MTPIIKPAYATNSSDKTFFENLETLEKIQQLCIAPIMFCLVDSLSKDRTFDFLMKNGYVTKTLIVV